MTSKVYDNNENVELSWYLGYKCVNMLARC